MLAVLLASITGQQGAVAALAAAWKPAGLSGITTYQLAVDPSGPGIVYAATTGGPSRAGLAKSVDGGRSWVPLERGLPLGFQPVSLAVSPDGGRTVLAAGVDGLFRSTSAGAQWSAVRVPLPPLTALLFDRDDARVVLAGTELHGNFASDDGGRTWRPTNAGLPHDRYGNVAGAVQLVQHPAESRTILMATNGFDGVYRSGDAGRSWRAAGNGLPSTAVRALAINPSAPYATYALTEKGLAISGNGGGTWRTITALPAIEPVALAFEPDAKDTAYVAGARGALLRSTDGGASWVELPGLPKPVRSLVCWTSINGPTLAAAAGEGVWRIVLTPTLPA